MHKTIFLHKKGLENSHCVYCLQVDIYILSNNRIGRFKTKNVSFVFSCLYIFGKPIVKMFNPDCLDTDFGFVA